MKQLYVSTINHLSKCHFSIFQCSHSATFQVAHSTHYTSHYQQLTKVIFFTPIHFSLITHHFFIIYLVILQMNEHIRLNAQKNVRGGVQNKQLQEINKP